VDLRGRARHLQATGRDARGRKQYRYHAAWRETRDADKFDQLAEFAQALPRFAAACAPTSRFRACRAARCSRRSCACWSPRASASATSVTRGE
jgi:hypothetical protein